MQRAAGVSYVRHRKSTAVRKLGSICKSVGVQLQSSGFKAPSGSWQPQPVLELVSDLHQTGEKSMKGMELFGAWRCRKKQLQAPRPSRDESNRWWCCSCSLLETARGSCSTAAPRAKQTSSLTSKCKRHLGFSLLVIYCITPGRTIEHPPACSFSKV